jgi:Zn-dependent metalloprotease
MKYFFLSVLFVCSLAIHAQFNPTGSDDPAERRFPTHIDQLNPQLQAQLRQTAAWKNFAQAHENWFVHFNERTQLPHRAYGKGIPVQGTTPHERAANFLAQHLADWNPSQYQLIARPSPLSKKFEWVNFTQFYQGLEVLHSRATVKMENQQVVLFGWDVFPIANVSVVPAISAAQAEAAAVQGIVGTITSVSTDAELKILPLPVAGAYEYKLVYSTTVEARNDGGTPLRYACLIDAASAEVLYRVNQIHHICDHGSEPCPVHPPVAVSVALGGTYHEFNPNVAPIFAGLPNTSVTVAGTEYILDEMGTATLPVNPGSTATVRLMGPWARVYSDNVTPTFTATLVDGDNALSFDANANIKERTVYVAVQQIHEHMKQWMPDFTALDFPLTTNVDVAGECNAFYDGSSINFFDTGGGCNASSLVPDIAYHEYGHGINDFFYQESGGFFTNGAMGEGYADFWALSLTNDPKLGVGFNIDNADPIRRYDQDPKVYPSDLIGQVHADGEIIMGAWYDSHLLMGANWAVTMPLFVETYAGLQAETFDGNEGAAYTDVLIDLLQADDTDSNLSNGTPNGDAIVQGFYLHGITLLSNATLEHEPILAAATEDNIVLEADLELELGFAPYLQSVSCTYKVNNGNWQTIAMNEMPDGSYSTSIPGQDAASVVYYYLSTTDINGTTSNVLPIGAALAEYPSIPNIVIVGAQIEGRHDCDNFEDWGAWATGLSGDNSSTGDWELNTPMGSYTTDVNAGFTVATDTQVTPGGEFCFVTENASNTAAPIGESDVDGGKTTLQSTIINMEGMTEPIVSYHRWYTNSPPGGANPGADFWQVRMSNNGGTTWTFVENTKTSDAQWRRNAFRVRDFMEPTANMRFQFIAADSIRPGQNLEGGSLVEAAVDDFFVWDLTSVSVDEQALATEVEWEVFPNPVQQRVTVSGFFRESGIYTMQWTAADGKLVHSKSISAEGQQKMTITDELPRLAPGWYTLRIVGDNQRVVMVKAIAVQE